MIDVPYASYSIWLYNLTLSTEISSDINIKTSKIQICIISELTMISQDTDSSQMESLTLEGRHFNLKLVISKPMPTIIISNIFCEIALNWMSQDLTGHD